MLSLIRDKLKTWVVIILVILVAIPLVFLGVGDYGTNQEQYALKVNDQEISKSVVLQEMGQFKDVLRKNYQGSIPPIYTDQFIKKLTLDNLVRRSIENNISSNAGLVLSDESIVDDIKNTSSFRDENGFNSKLYKRRLYMINMNPDVYEQYIYQKGIRDQLREAITNSSFLSATEKKININANYHKKTGKIYILNKNMINTDVKISLDEINEYYQNNKNDFMSNPEAEFSYIRLNKKNVISSIQVAEEEIETRYTENLKAGLYSADKLYEINHLVFPIRDDKDNALVSARKAYEELLSNKSFEYISKNYDVSEDTKNSSGYLGKQALIDLPDIIKSNLSKMQNGEIKLISSQSNAVHIIQLIDASSPGDKTYDQVKIEIKDQISNTKGSEKYFSLLDSIKEKLYANNYSLAMIADSYNLDYLESGRINQIYNDSLLTPNIVNRLFSKIESQELYPPIYIDNDDVLFVKKIKYYPSEQLSANDSEDAIRALLTTQINIDTINKAASEKLMNLNKGIDQDFESFSVYKYDKDFSKDIMSFINNQPVTPSFISHKTETGDFVFLKIERMDSGFIDKNKIESDNYLDYLRNTQSESDYNSFYISKYESFDVDINEEYLNQ